MNIYEYSDYKLFVVSLIKSLPKKGRGQLILIAKTLNIHTTMLTHILKGNSHFTIENALEFSRYFNFDENETDYFLLLVQMARSGNHKAYDFFNKKAKFFQKKGLQLHKKLKTANELSDTDRAIYYSSWTYTMVRLLTSIEKYQTLESISSAIDISENKVKEVLNFLVKKNLCVEDKGTFKYGNLKTYLESSSRYILMHHLNWRNKAREKFENLRDEDLIFTFPVILSDSDALKIREKIIDCIREVKSMSEKSPSEELYILNIDWLKFTNKKFR